jgi:menaquinone-dependent protoporphyrinogen oxidase
MPILILYATTEGQTRKIVRRAAQHLAQRGIASEVLPVTEAVDTDLGSCDAVLLAASVHG